MDEGVRHEDGAEVDLTHITTDSTSACQTACALIAGVGGVPCPEGKVSGNMEVWTQDQDRDCWRESGDGLPGRSDGRHGEVLLEVRSGQAVDAHVQRASESSQRSF